MHGIRNAKYDAGRGTKSNILPSGVYGIIVTIPIPKKVIDVKDADALL